MMRIFDVGASLKFLRNLVSGPVSPVIYLGGEPARRDTLVIQWAVGADAGRVDLADALLADAITPEQLRRVVRFCARGKWPVGLWLLSGLWYMPVGVEQVARWLVELDRAAGPAAIWVDDFLMPERYKNRLHAHLRRAGCRVVSLNPTHHASCLNSPGTERP